MTDEVISPLQCGEIVADAERRPYACHAAVGSEHSHADPAPHIRPWFGDIEHCTTGWCDLLLTPRAAAWHREATDHKTVLWTPES